MERKDGSGINEIDGCVFPGVATYHGDSNRDMMPDAPLSSSLSDIDSVLLFPSQACSFV